MNQACIEYIRTHAERLEEPIIDFGGRIVQSNFGRDCIRNLFPNKDYKTFDLDGDTDIRGDVYDTKLSSGSLGTAIAMSLLEHVAEPQKAVDEMARVLKPGGKIVLIVPMSNRIHRHPKDYWRIMPDGMAYILREFEDVEITHDSDPKCSLVYAIATKKGII